MKMQTKEVARVCLHALIYILTSLHSDTKHLDSNVSLL